MGRKKLAIVTGASRGIGNAIAITLAEEGYNIITIGKSPYKDALEGLKKISRLDVDVFYVEGSLSDEKARKELLEKALGIGKIDILVNNAGMAPRVREDFLLMKEESLREVLDTNLVGTFLLTQSVANQMVEDIKTSDHYKPMIINISSISAYTVSLNRAEYCLSKAGITMLTEIFAAGLAQYNIPVHEVRPGIIFTEMTRAVKEKYEKLIAEGLIPIGRLGEPQDVANAVSLLVSGKLSYSTGQIIDVDGGFHIRRL